MASNTGSNSVNDNNNNNNTVLATKIPVRERRRLRRTDSDGFIRGPMPLEEAYIRVRNQREGKLAFARIASAQAVAARDQAVRQHLEAVQAWAAANYPGDCPKQPAYYAELERAATAAVKETVRLSKETRGEYGMRWSVKSARQSAYVAEIRDRKLGRRGPLWLNNSFIKLRQDRDAVPKPDFIGPLPYCRPSRRAERKAAEQAAREAKLLAGPFEGLKPIPVRRPKIAFAQLLDHSFWMWNSAAHTLVAIGSSEPNLMAWVHAKTMNEFVHQNCPEVMPQMYIPLISDLSKTFRNMGNITEDIHKLTQKAGDVNVDELVDASVKSMSEVAKSSGFYAQLWTVVSNIVHVLISPTWKTASWAICCMLQNLFSIPWISVQKVMDHLERIYKHMLLKMGGKDPMSFDDVNDLAGGAFTPRPPAAPEPDDIHPQMEDITIDVSNSIAVEDAENQGFFRRHFGSIIAIVVSAIVTGLGYKHLSLKVPGSYVDRFVMIFKNYNNTVIGMLNFFRATADFFRDLYDLIIEKCFPSQYTLHFLAGHDEDIYNWAKRVQVLIDGRNRNSILTEPRRITQLYAAANEACLIQSKLLKLTHAIKPQQLSVLNKLITDILKLRDIAAGLHVAPPVKFEPFVLQLGGPSNIGKSFLLSEITIEMLRKVGYRTFSEPTYIRSPGNAYWNSLANQPICIFDDFLAMTAPEFSSIQLAELFQLKTRCVFNPPMAAVEDKNIRYNPVIVGIASNACYYNLSGVLDIDAIHRRRDMLWDVRLRPPYRHISEVPKEILRNFGHLQFSLLDPINHMAAAPDQGLDYASFEAAVHARFSAYYATEAERYRQVSERLFRLAPTGSEMETKFLSQGMGEALSTYMERASASYSEDDHEIKTILAMTTTLSNADRSRFHKMVGGMLACSNSDVPRLSLLATMKDAYLLVSGITSLSALDKEIQRRMTIAHAPTNDQEKLLHYFRRVEAEMVANSELPTRNVSNPGPSIVPQMAFKSVDYTVKRCCPKKGTPTTSTHRIAVRLAQIQDESVEERMRRVRETDHARYLEDLHITPGAQLEPEGMKILTKIIKNDFKFRAELLNFKNIPDLERLDPFSTKFINQIASTRELFVEREKKHSIMEHVVKPVKKDASTSPIGSMNNISITTEEAELDPAQSRHDCIHNFALFGPIDFQLDWEEKTKFWHIGEYGFVLDGARRQSFLDGGGAELTKDFGVSRFTFKHEPCSEQCIMNDKKNRHALVMRFILARPGLTNILQAQPSMLLGEIPSESYDFLNGVPQEEELEEVIPKGFFKTLLGSLGNIPWKKLGLFISAVCTALASLISIYGFFFGRKNNGDITEPQATNSKDSNATHSKAPHRTAGPPIKTEWDKPISIADIAGQMNEDVDAQTSSQIRRNTFFIAVKNKDSDDWNWKVSARCFGVVDRVAIFPAHYVDAWALMAKHTNVGFFYIGGNQTAPLEVGIDELIIHRNPSRALALMVLPKTIPCFRNLIGKFASGDSSYPRDLDSRLYELQANRKHGIQFDMCKTLVQARLNQGISVPASGVFRAFEVAGSYVYGYGGAGVCGSILCGDSGRIYGMHVAGSAGRDLGYAEIIGNEELERIRGLAKIQGQAPTSPDWIVADHPEKGNYVVPHAPTTFVATNYGRVPDIFTNRSPVVTAFRKSPISNALLQRNVPCHLVPAVLSSRDDRIDHRMSPLLEGVLHHGNPMGPLPSKIVDRCVDDLRNLILSKCPPFRGQACVLSESDAIVGSTGNRYIRSLDFTSSSGWPWRCSTRPKAAQKSSWVEVSGFESGKLSLDGLDPELRKVMDSKQAQRRAGIIPYTVFADVLKDETVHPRKIKPGGTRVISMSPIDFTIQQRQYTMHYVAAYMHNRLDLEHAVGIDPDSAEWTFLFKRLANGGRTKFIAGDYSKFGDRLPVNIGKACYSIIADWYELHGLEDEASDIRQTLTVMAEEVFSPLHIVNDRLYQTFAGMPSGNTMTVILNSMVNSVLIRIAWCSIMATTEYAGLDNFYKHVTLYTYGDDIISSISDEIAPMFNTETIGKFFGTYGLNFTDADKTGEIIKYRSAETVTFLKRTFRPFTYCEEKETGVRNLLLAGMDITTIESVPHWVKKGEEPKEYALMLTYEALKLAFTRGSDEYQKYAKIFKEIWRKRGEHLIVTDWVTLAQRTYVYAIPLLDVSRKYVQSLEVPTVNG